MSQSANLESTSATGTTAQPVHSVAGTDNFFDVFQVKPLLGRTFAPGEDQPGRNDVAVLSYELWQQGFGGSGSVVGSTIRLDGVATTVIGGVMPALARFRFR